MVGALHVLRIIACFLLLLRSFSATASGKPMCRQEELTLLLAFKNSFFNETNCLSGGSPLKMASWAAEEGNCCQWGGVTCHSEDGLVIGIDLSSSCLGGMIDSKASIFGLVNLQVLNLAFNNFDQSEIPPAIGRLTALSTLNLSGSGFSGVVIPQVISTLSNLTTLDLSRNQAMNISGLGELLRSLNKIEELHLSTVMLSDRKVPTILANMTSLRSLDLSNSRLSGEFPDSIFALPRLEFLDVSLNNGLTGRLTEFYRGSQIKSLRLSMMNLTGGLPASLGNLSHLTRIDLSYCGLSGEIPSSIGNLTSLKYLDLSSNNFQGPIPPSLGDLTNLTNLDLYSNRLTGEIPSSLGSLVLLKRLYLSSNKLGGGIPASLMQLSKLDVLDLSNNLLTGSIPSQISNLTLLTFLWLSSNKLSGPIPHSIYGLPGLTLLFLQSNNLTGEARLDLLLELKEISRIDFSSNGISSVVFPKSTANITQIGMLSLDSCNLTEVPQFLEHQNSLDWLSFSNNNISGHVPQWLLQKPFQNLDLSFNNIQGTLPIPSTSINYYLMSNNQLSGEIPSSICELKGILVLDLADNEFTGALPPCLGNFSFFLSALSLSGNNFVGKIPDFNNVINFISLLDLSSNSFEGPLPKSLLNCSVLKYVNLGRNKIVDTFPSWLGSLPLLKVLMLHSNGFYGEMKAPRNVSWFPSLQVITLSNNNMAGILPSDYFAHLPAMKYFSPDDDKYPSSFVERVSLTIISKGIEREFGKTLGSFTLLDLSSNNFNGTIPDSIGDNLLKLHTLNLSSNDLSGPIPLSLVNLKNLEVLDLSRNRLSGVIPGVFAQITSLNIFNVSYNNLSGYIPVGNQFGTFENSSYIGNPELCGTPLTKKCGNAPKPPPITEDGHGEDTHLQLGIVWITALVGLAGGLMVGVALEHAFGAKFLCWMEAKRHKNRR